MLTDSLVISQLTCALPVWGPMLSNCQSQHLQRLDNWGTCITANVQKFDHMFHHCKKLNWLSFP